MDLGELAQLAPRYLFNRLTEPARGLARAKEYLLDEPAMFSVQQSMQAFPDQDSSSTQQDAMRHMLWMAQLGQRIGTPMARLAGLTNEALGSIKGQPIADMAMDLRNNEFGLQSLAGLPEDQMIARARELATNAQQPPNGTWGALGDMLSQTPRAMRLR